MKPALLRIGPPAALFDATAAVAAVGLAYSIRFPLSLILHFLGSAAVPLSLTVLLQLATGAAAGLYSSRGQELWPVRLATGAIAGAVLALLATFGLDVREGVSREAMVTQVPLFWLFGALWRSWTGLLVRQEMRQALRDQFGDSELVEIGRDMSSMTGGVLRTWQYHHLLVNIVTKDLKLKYQRSILGFAWSLLNPLVMMAVYTFAFRYVMKVPTERFVLFILIGVLAWNFFVGSITSASDAVIANASLQKSVVFPRAVLPFSTVLFNLSLYLLTIVVFLPVMLLVYRVEPAPRMLLFPFILFLQVVFITGLTLLLSTASTLFRDVKHLIEVGINVLFWTTPIVYEPTMIPARFQRLALLSPMAPFVRAYQDIFYYGVVPSGIVWTVAIVYAVGIFVCGLSVFLAYEDSFAEHL
jgi:ABC-type polysaccharide/polyol phosphate export permease